MSDKLFTLKPEDYRIQPQEIRVGPYSYMGGHPPFVTGARRLMDFGISTIRGEKVRFFDAPSRPYVFKVDELAYRSPDGLFETTPTPDLRVMDGHASRLANGLWIFANGIPVVEGVRAWNQVRPQERVSLVNACQDARIDPTSVDVAPFKSEEHIMAVYAGSADAGFCLTESGKVVGVVKVDQFPTLRGYLANLPTFKL